MTDARKQGAKKPNHSIPFPVAHLEIRSTQTYAWSMNFIRWACCSTLVLCLLATPAVSRSEHRVQVVDFGCRDLVAIGRIRTLKFDDLSLPDDLLGHGRFWMDVSLKKVLKGKERRSGVPTTQIAHAQLREDRDFLVVLSPMENGAYSLKSAQLWKQRPKPVLSKSCTR